MVSHPVGGESMKYALISDIHANLPALEAVLADIDREAEVDTIYHLGDLVGYAPWPNEVVALLKERGITGIAGNYDSTTATDYPHCGCKADSPRGEELSHLSYEWTREHVTAETKRFLGALPFNAWCEFVGRKLSGRCPRIRVGLPIPIPEGKGTDSSWSVWTPSSPYSTSWSTTSASPVRKRNSTPD